MRDHENLDRHLSDISFRTQELLRHTEHYKAQAANWHEAWRYAYRGEEELGLIAIRFRDATKLMIEMRIRALDVPSAADAGHLTRKILKEYLGCVGPFYSEVYAGLGDTVLTEDSPEASALVSALSDRLAEVLKLPADEQKQEVDVLSLISSTLAFRSDPSPERQQEYLNVLKELLMSRVEKSSVILELLNG